MKKNMMFSLSLLLCTIFASLGFAKDYSGKKIFFVDSYHEGYPWSDGITEGVKNVLDGTGVKLKIFRMDTKRNTGDEFKKEAALRAKAAIESFKPDVLIAADDNASKYLVAPYYKDGDLPVVFCGVNWDADVYGYPYKNVTGMVEVTPLSQLLEQLRPFAKGDRIGFVSPNLLTARKEVKNYEKVFGYSINAYYAKDFEDWKKGFIKLQEKTDMMIIFSHGGLYKNMADEMKSFVEAGTKIPTGAINEFMSAYALMTFGKIPQEQGSWSAKTALKILDGTKPADIPLVRNKNGKFIINARIAARLGAEIPADILLIANRIIE